MAACGCGMEGRWRARRVTRRTNRAVGRTPNRSRPVSVFKLFQFFAGASDYASPDQEALDQAGDDAPGHAAFYRVIVYVSAFFGVVGALAGVALAVMTLAEPKAGRDGAQVLLAPVMFGA